MNPHGPAGLAIEGCQRKLHLILEQYGFELYWPLLQIFFFRCEYYSTTQQDPLQAESTNIEPQIWRKRSAEG